MQPLQHQQPHDYQGRVNAVVASYASVRLGLVQKLTRQQFLEQREHPWKGGFSNERRERECWSCLKSQDSPPLQECQVLCAILLTRPNRGPQPKTMRH